MENVNLTYSARVTYELVIVVLVFYMLPTANVVQRQYFGFKSHPNNLRSPVGCEPEGRMLPTPRDFCRHILSERTTQAASNKRRLHPVSGGISL